MSISVYVDDWHKYSRGKTDSYPEMNMSNVNWADMSKVLYLDTRDGVGELSIQEIPLVIGRCIRFINTEVSRAQVVRVASRYGNLIDIGTSDDYLLRKAERFMEILKFVQILGKGVYWG